MKMKLSNEQLEKAVKLYVQTRHPRGDVNARKKIVTLMQQWGYAVSCIISAVTSEQKEWPENQLRIGTQQKDEPWAKLRDMLEGCTMSSRGNVLTITVDDVDTCALDVMIAIDDLIGRRESKRMPSRKELDPLVIDPPQEWLDEPDASEQNDEVSE